MKHVTVLIFLLSFLSILATSQTKLAMANSPDALKAAADREATNNGVAGDPHQRLQQELVSREVAERQSQLRLDAEKLALLAAELKQHIDKTNPSVLSMDVIKKAGEIQKLAKSVEDKMKNAY